VLVHWVYFSALAGSLVDRLWSRRSQRGQTSAEYALVLLGAAAVAMLVVAWAAKTDRISRLLDAVVDQVLSRSRP
jgi:fatty-acid desaturase